MKIAISIGCYDAFEDLRISTNIIRENWTINPQPYLICGITRQIPQNNADLSLFDEITRIETPRTPALKCIDAKDNSFPAANTRCFHSIIETGRIALKKDMDYIVYLNSGSWMLQPEAILDVIKLIKDKVIATRIAIRQKYFVVEDHFLVVNLKQAKERNLYDIDENSRPYNPVSFNSNYVHGMLRTWLEQTQHGDVCVYSDQGGCINNYMLTPMTLNPLIFDPKYNFLHSNKGNEGVHFLRRKYVEKYVVNKNQLLKEYIESCPPLSKKFKYFSDPYPHYKLNFLSKLPYLFDAFLWRNIRTPYSTEMRSWIFSFTDDLDKNFN